MESIAQRQLSVKKQSIFFLLQKRHTGHEMLSHF